MGEHKHTVKTTCKFCRKEFDSFGLKKVCPDCDTNMDDWYRAIRAFIKEFPDTTVSELCDTLSVPPALIKYYLKEERIEIKNNEVNYFLKCEKCNKPITSGRLCPACQITVTREEMETVLIHNPENEKMERDISAFHSRIILRK